MADVADRIEVLLRQTAADRLRWAETSHEEVFRAAVGDSWVEVERGWHVPPESEALAQWEFDQAEVGIGTHRPNRVWFVRLLDERGRVVDESSVTEGSMEEVPRPPPQLGVGAAPSKPVRFLEDLFVELFEAARSSARQAEGRWERVLSQLRG